MGSVRPIRLHRITVSHRTTWLVTEVTTEDGLTGLGECSDLSAHLSMLPVGFAHIKYAFGEPVDRTTVLRPVERISAGELHVAPGAGLGVELTKH